MAYKLEPGKMYRMPTHFGPSLGPRQGENGKKHGNLNSPRETTISVSFLTNRKQLEDMLPEGFEVSEEPIVTVELDYITEIEWLAGRGYNTLGVRFPAVFHGKKDHVKGRFLTVLWENLGDPIFTGREELGFNKVYCELPEPRVYQGQTHCIANWMGFRFMDLRVWNLKQLSSRDITSLNKQTDDGILHFKYMPRTGQWGKADIAYATLTPSTNPNRVVKEMWQGEGEVQFHKAKWEDLPTIFHIVNAFHSLEVKEYHSAVVVKTVGSKDLGDQRILE